MTTTARIPLTPETGSAVREAADYDLFASAEDCATHGRVLIRRVDSMPSMMGYGEDCAVILRCGHVLTSHPGF
jgi:hypothetical protein